MPVTKNQKKTNRHDPLQKDRFVFFCLSRGEEEERRERECLRERERDRQTEKARETERERDSETLERSRVGREGER